MLLELHIRDFAIIDRLHIEFDHGMNVITGETGAGKSIAIDALSIVLGDRATGSVVRKGAEKAEIIASFDISKNRDAKSWLRKQSLDEDEVLIVRRMVPADGSSRAFVNDRPVTVQVLKELAEFLVDIHSQHAHQSLLKNEEQRRLLDAYAGLEPQVQQLNQFYRNILGLQRKRQEQLQSQRDLGQRLDYLNYQLEELETLNYQANEWESLGETHQQLANHSKIQDALQMAVNELYESDYAIIHRLQSIKNSVEALVGLSSQFKTAEELIDSALIQLTEATDDLRAHADDTELDPEQLRQTEQRMQDIIDISRKHHIRPEDLGELQQRFSGERDQLQNFDVSMEALNKEIEQFEKQYHTLAAKVSEQRSIMAEKFAKAVNQYFKKLGMPDCLLQIQLQALPAPGASGMETVEILIRTNAGQDFKAMAKIASGGELSRISLAIQVVCSKVAKIPCLVFDEVDVGIGGAVAEVVGQLLHDVAQSRQVICITHQAQVAAFGQRHFQVQKQSSKNSTATRVIVLKDTDRVQEIARMIGGVEITDATLAHAEEMLAK